MYWTHISDFSSYINILQRSHELQGIFQQKQQRVLKQPGCSSKHWLARRTDDRHRRTHVIWFKIKSGPIWEGTTTPCLGRLCWSTGLSQTDKNTVSRGSSFALFPTTEATWLLTKGGLSSNIQEPPISGLDTKPRRKDLGIDPHPTPTLRRSVLALTTGHGSSSSTPGSNCSHNSNKNHYFF